MDMIYLAEFFATVSCTFAMYKYVSENTTVVVACPMKSVNVWSRYEINRTVAYIINGKINPGLSVSSRLATNNDGDLIINDFQNVDVGKYRCSATNETSPIWYDITLRRKWRPVFAKQNAHYLIYCDIGEKVDISFQVFAYPIPNVLWTTYDCGGILREWNVTSDLDEPYNHTITSSVYVADIAQLGKYVASVRNSEGSVHLNIRFTVKSAPIVKKKDVLVNDMEVWMLVYFVTNLDDVAVEWYVNDKSIHISNISFTTEVNKSVFSSPDCGQLSQNSGCISKIQINKKYISDIDTMYCELRSLFGSRVYSFNFEWINSLIRDFDSKQMKSTSSDTWNVTSELSKTTASISTTYLTASTSQLRNLSENLIVVQESDVGQSEIYHIPGYMFIVVAGAVLVIGIVVVMIVVLRTRHGLKTGSNQEKIVNAKSQQISTQEVIEVIEDSDRVSLDSEYDEIDSVSYNSVAWRNYTLENDQELQYSNTTENNSCRSMPNYENIIIYEQLQCVTTDDSHSYYKVDLCS